MADQQFKTFRVTDLPILGRATIEEARSLLAMLHHGLGYDKLAVSGSSMGGLHAAMVATLMQFPVGMVAWMAPPSAIPAFVSGILSSSCAWESLCQDQKYLTVLQMVREKDATLSDSPNVRTLLREFLRITSINNFPVPLRPDATYFAVGDHDAYIGSVWEEWNELLEHWQTTVIEQFPVGHISGILFQNQQQQGAIRRVLDIL